MPVLCIAPGGTDKIILVNYQGTSVESTLHDTINQFWISGIQNVSRDTVCGCTLTEFKLGGTPWYSRARESVASRALLAKIIQKMSGIGWKFHCAVNIKGGTDSLFFIKQDYFEQPLTTSVISMNRTDRVRLIGFMNNDSDSQAIGRCINNPHECRDYHGSIEFKLKGTPFHCSGHEAIKTRKLLNRILETVQLQGYDPMTGLDVSRKDHDKSVIIFSRTNSQVVSYACVALSSTDTLRLIDFPDYEQERLAEVVRATYPYGIRVERAAEENCREFGLNVITFSLISFSFSLNHICVLGQSLVQRIY